MCTAAKTYCRAALSTHSPISETSIRQMVAFPSDTATRHASGFVRQRYFLLELEGGAVYHLSAPYNWGPLPDRVATLAEAITSHDRSCPHQEHIATVVAWAIETQLVLADLDLSAPTTSAWPVRAAALQRCYLDSITGESTEQLAVRLALAEATIADAASAALRQFVDGLNPDILSLSSLWGCMPWARYNWFAGVQNIVRTYRIQMARIFPALVPILSGELGPSGLGAQTLAEVVDRGEPLVEALARTYGVRVVTARHALTMPPALVAGEKLPTLIRAMDQLIPERFPREPHEWTVFETLVYDAIPKLTNRPAASPDNLSFLPEIGRKGWTQAESRWSRLCVGDGAAATIAEFLKVYKQALTWDLVQHEGISEAHGRQACTQAVDEALVTVGLFSLFDTSASFSTAMREAKQRAKDKAQAEYALQLEVLRRAPWTSVLKEPAMFEECEIVPLLTAAALTQTGEALENCLDEHYADECASGRANIFSIYSAAGGALLGALHLRFPVGRYGGFETDVCDCKGPRNAVICPQGKRAVTAFREWLKTAEAQRRISDLPRKRLELRKVEFDERFEMESTITALRQLRQRSLRFDALRKQVLDILANSAVQTEISPLSQIDPMPKLSQPLSQSGA